MIAKRRFRVGAIAAAIAIALVACLLPSMAHASGDSPKITLHVIDEHEQPVKGVEMVLMGTDSGDPNKRQEIAKAVSDENGDAKFFAENLVGLTVGAYLDCDPAANSNYEWALTWAGNSGSVRWIADGAVGAEKWNNANPHHAAKVTNVDALNFTFVCVVNAKTYQIGWDTNGDGQVDDTTTVNYRETPSHADGAKDADAQYTYAFTGWSPAVEPATRAITYTAQFSETVNTYTVVWVNEDNTELEKDENVAYGTMPSYDGAVPTKAQADGYAYTFSGWSPEVASVVGNATYTAQFSKKCVHAKDQTHCADLNCAHPADCACAPDATKGERTITLITKLSNHERVGNVKASLWANYNGIPGRESEAHQKLGEFTTDSNGEVVLNESSYKELLEGIPNGASIYMNVEGDHEWAGDPSTNQVRIVSGYDKLVNAGIIGDPNHSAWITAGGTAGFSVEFTLLVKEKAPEPTGPVAAKIHLVVTDTAGNAVSGVKFDIKAMGGTAPEGSNQDAAGRVVIGSVVTDAEGKATLLIEDVWNSEVYGFGVGTIIDCDPVGENFIWDPANHSTGGSRTIDLSSAAGIVLSPNPNHAAQITQEGMSEGVEFTFACQVVNQEQSYTVVFNANGGTGSMADQVVYLDAETALNANEFARDGYTFLGWSTKFDATSAELADEALILNKAGNGESYALYAVWELDEYTVEFDANGGEGSMDDQTFACNEDETLPANSFTKSGFTFAGWDADGDGKVDYTDKAVLAKGTFDKGEALKLVAIWKPVYFPAWHDCPSDHFTDFDQSRWYHRYIDWAVVRDVIRGYDDGSGRVGPEDNTTRAQVVTMLYRMAGEPVVATDPGFNDVKEGAWYYEEIAWAKSVGLITGYLDGSDNFGPNDLMTREQMATVLYRYAQLNGCDVSVGESTNVLSYVDAFEISEYAVPAVQWAVGAGIISGYTDAAGEPTGFIGPKDPAERGHFAAMLMRMNAAYGIL